MCQNGFVSGGGSIYAILLVLGIFYVGLKGTLTGQSIIVLGDLSPTGAVKIVENT